MFETPDCTSSGPPSTTWQSLGFRNIPETAASTLWGFSIALSTPDIKTYRVDLFIKGRRSKFFSSKMMTRFFAKDSALCWKWELLYLSPAAQTYFSKPAYNFILSSFLPCPEISQFREGFNKKISQELRMLSSVTINWQITKIVMNDSNGYLWFLYSTLPLAGTEEE